MYAGLPYIPLIVAGLAGIAWGMPAAHRLRSPFDAGAAAVVLAGVVSAVLGVLLTIIPGFFR